MISNTVNFDTLAVHAGKPAGFPRPAVVPIYTATSFAYETTDDLDAAFTGAGPYYQRYGNPTTDAFERACAALEGAEGAVAFASGMAALHGVLLAAGIRSGDAIVASRDLYGVTVRLLNEVFVASGVTTHFVDTTDAKSTAETIARVRPRTVLCEAMSNPLLKLVDIKALADVAHTEGASFIVDSTFTTPWLVQPHSLGADFVMHSATKYLGGHGDVLGGVVTTHGENLKALKSANVVVGAVLAPFDAAMLLRGLRTLALRMERHCSNGLAIAQWLQGRPEIARVYYPGLGSHPQHALAKRLFGGRGFGGMVSFDLLNGNRAIVSRFIDSLQLALPGPTLGDVETLVMYPAIASHRALTSTQRAELGISDGLVRLSVGIENPLDIVADLAQALEGGTGTAHG